MRVVLHTAAGPGLAARLSAFAAQDLDVIACPEADEARLAVLLREAEVLWHVLKPATGAMMAAAPNLRLIQKIGTGVNTIDLDAARARGIAVCNLPGVNAPAVAEMTLLLILAALRRLPLLDAATRAGEGWALDPSLQDQFSELGGLTVGLVGYGAVPQALAPLLQAFGCRILYTASGRKTGVLGSYRRLSALLAQSDVVSLHLPLTAKTERIMDAAAFAQMKSGAVLVNTARGGLVDHAALVAALESGRLGAAGLDVFAQEPPAPDDPLFAFPNVVVAPHVAWLTTGTFDRALAKAAENCRRLAQGKRLLHQVV
ncbi:MAG: 2-hydroxyacid dehydrogenase [Alphaproteobacteria bacterium]|nr:2-hydroxyacid dehydrogenase [Alphaproteobacteria bacterium]